MKDPHNLQHAPSIHGNFFRVRIVHNQLAKLAEEFALKGLGKEISDHLLGGTVGNRKFLVVDPIGDEEEADIEMTSSFAAGTTTVALEKDRALVVLVQHGILESIALLRQKVVGPDDHGHLVVSGNLLGFGGTSSVHFLFARVRIGKPTTKG